MKSDVYGVSDNWELTASPVVVGAPSFGEAHVSGDPINPALVPDIGSQVIYKTATGFEKALADTEWQHLAGIYAELIRDQWDPYKVSARNLPYLAWAMGVNLWEDDWSIDFKRWWVDQQWRLKYERGSVLGLTDFVTAVGGQVLSVVRPPAKFFPGPAMTPAEKAAYLAIFPQLRLYPYVARANLPYSCFMPNFPVDPVTGDQPRSRNGSFLGPLRKFYPTNTDAGGRYTRTSEIWDHGVVTPLTFRTVERIDVGTDTVTTFDQVVIPAEKSTYWYMGQNGRFFLPKGHPRTQNVNSIFLGTKGATDATLINVPRDGSLDVAQYKAMYTTLSPSLDPVDIYPNHVAEVHPVRPASFFCGMPLTGKYMTPSIAWQHTYEQWYLFDPDRVPPQRKTSCYMGVARFGIQKYTAEAKIRINGTTPSWWFGSSGGFVRGYMRPKDTSTVDKLRRAVVASMAVRDTVRINTKIKRTLQVSDSILCDGSHYVGELVDS